jgi:hypothetical protein
MFKEHEPMKAAITANWQTKKQMCDSFVHIIT